MSFKAGSIIRNIVTGKPLKILHTYKGGAVVVDLESRENPTPTMVLLERDWDKWIDENKLTARVQKKSWEDSGELIWSLV